MVHPVRLLEPLSQNTELKGQRVDSEQVAFVLPNTSSNDAIQTDLKLMLIELSEDIRTVDISKALTILICLNRLWRSRSTE